MTPELRNRLNQIAEWLQDDNDDNACHLWHILTALRGPDEIEYWPFKDRTTCIIRSAAFPRVAAPLASCALPITEIQRKAVFASPEQVHAGIPVNVMETLGRVSREKGTQHFYDHVEFAARILGVLSDENASGNAAGQDPRQLSQISNIQ